MRTVGSAHARAVRLPSFPARTASVTTCPSCGDQFADDVAFCPKDGARLSAARGEADLVGTIIADRYRITSRIGGGGMGQVYKAEHIRMKRQCAVKVLRANLAGDPEATQRFQREAENASQLSHPNVAQIYDFGEHAQLVYLAMEFIDGESLAALLQRESAVHPDVAADIISQSAAALEAAHARGVLHRDVKPDNIMLGKNPDGTFQVKLVDFGIARAMTSDEQRVTRTGLVIGTPEFMSPEQIAGEELDARSDLYALALVAFQCLTGKDAFPATSSKQNLIMRLTSRPRTLLEVRGDVPWPESLQQVFDRALAPDPSERYDSVGLFAEELWAAIGAMTPTQTAELYRRALEQRVVSVASRTPMSNPKAMPAASVGAPTLGVPSPYPAPTTAAQAIPTAAPTAPPFNAGQSGTPYVTHGAFSAPAPPRAEAPMPELRRRPHILPWLFAFALAGWAFIVSTGRTEQARAAFDAVVSNVTGLIGTGKRLTEQAPASREADVAPARRSAPTGGQREGTPTDSGSIPSLSEPPKVVAPDPTVPPVVADTTVRPPASADSSR
jgi:eukaryotic-like serine/threonine-protein kinase